MTKPIDYTKPVQTVGSVRHPPRPVEIMFTDGRGDLPVGGYIGDKEDIEVWSIDGKYFGPGTTSTYDLENVPEGENDVSK